MKINIIGYGSMGKRRLANVRKLAPDALVSVTDISESRLAEAVADGATVDWGAVAINPDAVFICTPPNGHEIPAMYDGVPTFIEAGIAPVPDKPNIWPSCSFLHHPGVDKFRRSIAALDATGCVLHHCGQHLADWHPGATDHYALTLDAGGVREMAVFELAWLGSIWPIATLATSAVLPSQGRVKGSYAEEVFVSTWKIGNRGILTSVIDGLARPIQRRIVASGERGSVILTQADGLLSILTTQPSGSSQIWSSPVEEMYEIETAAFLRGVPNDERRRQSWRPLTPAKHNANVAAVKWWV